MPDPRITPHPEASTGPYVIDHGDVWFAPSSTPPRGSLTGPRRLHICGPGDTLAIAYDAEHGTLLKHGREDMVREWCSIFVERTSTLGDLAPPAPDVITFPVTPETIVELNSCIHITGHVRAIALGMQKPPDEPALPTP